MKGLLLVFALLPAPVGAQALPTEAQRHVADIASYATVGLNIALDTRASCWQAADRRRGCLLEAARLGTTYGAVALLKHVLPRDRPCAPACGIDRANADFPSGHTAFAFESAVGASGFVLAFSTADLRMLAAKHDLIGVLGGAAIGSLTGHFLR